MRKRVVVQPNVGLDVTSTILLNLLSGRVCAPQPPRDGLVSPSFSVPRSCFETLGRIKVPETCRAVLFGAGETIYDIGPGVHNLNFCAPGPLFGRLVDTSVRRITERLSGVRTADMAEITVEVQLQFQVVDAVAVIEMQDPVATLQTMLRGAVREQIQQVPHAAIFGNSPNGDVMAGLRLERHIRQALLRYETLEVFRIWTVQLTPVEGDSRYLGCTTRIELARQEMAAATIELEARQAVQEREQLLAMQRAQAERLRLIFERQAEVDSARAQQQAFECQLAARSFEMEQERFRVRCELERARAEAMAQALQPFAAPYPIGAAANSPFAYGGHSPARDEALLRLVERLTSPASGNGHDESKEAANDSTKMGTRAGCTDQ